MITLNTGAVLPAGTPPAITSTVPKLYPEPPFEIVTDSTLEALLITTVASAPGPSP